MRIAARMSGRERRWKMRILDRSIGRAAVRDSAYPIIYLSSICRRCGWWDNLIAYIYARCENSRENARHASLTRLDKGTRARLAARPGSRDRLRASGFIRLALGGCVLEYFIRVYLSAPHIHLARRLTAHGCRVPRHRQSRVLRIITSRSCGPCEWRP